jgi:hypothetical protein
MFFFKGSEQKIKMPLFVFYDAKWFYIMYKMAAKLNSHGTSLKGLSINIVLTRVKSPWTVPLMNTFLVGTLIYC